VIITRISKATESYVKEFFDQTLYFIMFAIIGLCWTKVDFIGDKLLFWQVFSMIPLLNRTYGHYFLTPMVLFFIGYIVNQKYGKFKEGVNNDRL
jgi:hypothetical protein